MIAKNTKPSGYLVRVVCQSFINSSVLPINPFSFYEVRLVEVFTLKRPWRNLIAKDHVALSGIYTIYYTQIFYELFSSILDANIRHMGVRPTGRGKVTLA